MDGEQQKRLARNLTDSLNARLEKAVLDLGGEGFSLKSARQEALERLDLGEDEL